MGYVGTMRRNLVIVACALTTLAGCTDEPKGTEPGVLDPAVDDGWPDACAPTDDVPGEHEPSQERGRAIAPQGGGPYDPRLAGCDWSSNGTTDIHYDEHGRATSLFFIDATTSYTWSDEGCLTSTTFEDIDGTETVMTARCDNHGHPVCVSTPDEAVEVITNTYDGEDRLVSAHSDRRRYEYTWEGDTVVEWTYTDDDSTTTFTATWSGDLLVGATSSEAGGAASGWSATLDEQGRIATQTWLDGSAYTWEYAETDPWPVEIFGPDGTRTAIVGASCP